MKEKKGKLRLTAVLLMIGFIPLLASGIVVAISTAIATSSNLTQDVYDKLYVSADGLRKYYQYELEAGNEMPYEHDYVDMLKGDDIEMTLFMGDTRYMTSALNAQGQRNEGTQMDAAIWTEVKSGKDYYGDGVVIGGKEYYVYYRPLYDGDGQVAGAAWAGTPEADVKANIRKSVLSAIIVIIVSCIIFGIIIVFVANKIIKILNHVIEEVSLVSKGNLTSTDNPTSAISEINSLGGNVVELRDELTETISGVKDNINTLVTDSNGLSGAASESNENMNDLANAVDEIANGATSQANEVQESAENVSEIMVNLEKINGAVKATLECTDTMSKDSVKVVDDFDVLIEDTQKSIEDLKAIANKMDAVAKAVEAVTNAAEEINGIASQTNLLSLNASIEAARAGEAGRGFAVVAGEISSLSDQSNAAAATIKDIMNNLKTETDEAISMVSEVNSKMEIQGENSKQSQESLQALVEAIESTIQNVQDVKTDSDEVQVLCGRLNDSISNLSAISEENAASAQETAASIEQVRNNTERIQGMAGDLKDISDVLDKLTDHFKL